MNHTQRVIYDPLLSPHGYTPIHHSNTIVKFTDDTMVVELVFGSVVQRTCFLIKQRQKSSLCLLDFKKNEKVTQTLLINRDLESVSDFCGLTHQPVLINTVVKKAQQRLLMKKSTDAIFSTQGLVSMFAKCLLFYQAYLLYFFVFIQFTLYLYPSYHNKEL